MEKKTRKNVSIYSNSAVICSSVLPRVSGRKKNSKTPIADAMMANIQYVQSAPSTRFMSATKYAKRKEVPQFNVEQTEAEKPFARGSKNSPITSQGTGPKVKNLDYFCGG